MREYVGRISEAWGPAARAAALRARELKARADGVTFHDAQAARRAR